MKAGLSSLLFACGKVEEAIEAAARLGYETVEIVYDFPHFGSGKEPAATELKRMINDNSLGVTIHSSFWDLNPASFYPEVRKLTLKRIEKSAMLCAKLDGEILVVHPGKCPVPDSLPVYAKSAELYRKFLDELLPCVKEVGVKVCIENGNSRDNPHSLLPELGGLVAEKEIGMTLDVAHAFLRYGSKNVDKIVQDLKKVRCYVQHVHLHDNLGQRDDHMVPGEGKLKLKKIIDCLREGGYSSIVVAELWNPKNPWEIAKRAKKALENLGIT
jgi:sugar phosphate isomerase/epimerase